MTRDRADASVSAGGPAARWPWSMVVAIENPTCLGDVEHTESCLSGLGRLGAVWWGRRGWGMEGWEREVDMLKKLV
jgi:hypothetical protein